MNTHTGEIVSEEELAQMEASRRKQFIPVKRDLSATEKFNKKIAMYSPCACGSGRKFKFCCWADRNNPKSHRAMSAEERFHQTQVMGI